MDSSPPYFSCQHSSPTPNGARVGSVCRCGSQRSLFSLCNHVNTVLTKGPAGVEERWWIHLLPTAWVSLDFLVFSHYQDERPSSSWLGGRSPATVPPVTSLSSQTAVLARAPARGETQHRRDFPKEAGRAPK